MHLAVLDLESGPGRLRDLERRRRGAKRRIGGGAQLGILARYRRVAVGVEEIEDLAGGEVHVYGNAFDGMRVVVLPGRGVVRCDAHDAAGVVARQPEVARRPRHRENGVGVADPANAHGLAPARVGTDDAVGQRRIVLADGRLGSGDLFPRRQLVGGKICHRFVRAVGVAVVDDGEGAARRSGVAEHGCLGGLVESDEAEPVNAAQASRSLNDGDGRANLLGSERSEGIGRRSRATRHRDYDEAAESRARAAPARKKAHGDHGSASPQRPLLHQ